MIKNKQTKAATYSKVVFIADKQKNLPEILQSQKKYVDELSAKGKSEVYFVFNGEEKVFVVVYAPKKNTSHSILLEDVRVLGSKLCKLANANNVSALWLDQPSSVFSKELSLAFIEGLDLTNYEFYKYLKAGKPSNSLTDIYVQDRYVDETAIAELSNVMHAVKITKDIVNEPVIFFNAHSLGEFAKEQGKQFGFSVKVLNKKQITDLKMGGLLGVNRGSIDEPTFTVMEYKPRGAKNKKPLVLVGKGVVYDTGGYNLKINGVMGTMKCDMAGGAAVIGAMTAIASNKLPIHVVGLVPATDNRIGLNALVQDDIITMSDGTTVEIQNTDAEGRLILADALVYAQKYDPALVIDLATLTGAAAAVTGPYGIALMANATKYKEHLIETGDEVYERCAEFMMWREYNDLLKSDVADLKNIGGPTGGMITAAKFLEHFTKYDWIHLDIAGPAFIKEGAAHYRHRGGSGVGVRLLYKFAKKFIGKK
jgi:leucyl aminopeptidase